MPAPHDPTILVKKADGTTVRMTLAEVEAMKKTGEQTSVPPAKQKPVVEKKVVSTPPPQKQPAPVPAARPQPQPLKARVNPDDYRTMVQAPPVKQERPLPPPPPAAARPMMKSPTPMIPSGGQQQKPIVRDVLPPPDKKMTMGPVDEFRIFSLSDWRRLGPTPTQIVPVLLSKFMALRDESYVLYMDAMQVWYDSPLVRMYTDVVLRSLSKRVSVQAAMNENAQTPDALTMAEFEAIVQLNSQLT